MRASLLVLVWVLMRSTRSLKSSNNNTEDTAGLHTVGTDSVAKVTHLVKVLLVELVLLAASADVVAVSEESGLWGGERGAEGGVETRLFEPLHAPPQLRFVPG